MYLRIYSPAENGPSRLIHTGHTTGDTRTFVLCSGCYSMHNMSVFIFYKCHVFKSRDLHIVFASVHCSWQYHLITVMFNSYCLTVSQTNDVTGTQYIVPCLNKRLMSCVPAAMTTNGAIINEETNVLAKAGHNKCLFGFGIRNLLAIKVQTVDLNIYCRSHPFGFQNMFSKSYHKSLK